MGPSRTDFHCHGDNCPGNIFLGTFVHIRNISAFTEQTLKVGRFMEPLLTDANHYGDICPVNICPGGICPYQEYLSFEQTVKEDSERKSFYLNNFYPKHFGLNIFLTPNFFVPHIFLDKIFLTKIFIGSNTFRP